MRVLFILREKNLSFDYNEFLKDLAFRLEKDGYDITTIFIPRNRLGQKGSSLDHADQVLCEERLLPGNLPLYLMKNKFDTVIMDVTNSFPCISAFLVRKELIPFLAVDINGKKLSAPASPNHFLYKSLATLCRAFFKKVRYLTIFSSTLDGMKKKPGNRANLLPWGVDLAIFRTGIKSRQPSVICFSDPNHFEDAKESIYVMRYIVKKYPEAILYIIGAGGTEAKLKEVALEKKIEGRVFLFRPLPAITLSRLLSSCWLHMHTSTQWCSTYITMKASACGTPTVAFDVPGMEDVLQNGMNGIRVENYHRTSFIDASLSIISDNFRWSFQSRRYAEQKPMEISLMKLEEFMESAE